MDQQQQTLDYFRTHAMDWHQKAENKSYSNIENRHRAVLETMKRFPEGSTLLDVGCGTGQLAIEAAQLGWTALGVDFAQEMVDTCILNNMNAKSNAKFQCASIFDFEINHDSYDLISAMGFIEYISLEELEDFLSLVYKALKVNGALCLGSRNRLFNLHSLNEFTKLEVALGNIDRLITESIIIQEAKTQSQALKELGNLNHVYDQPDKHPVTGIKVETRYQFTPADLMARLSRHKLKASAIYPVHYHILPISLMNDENFKKIHDQFAKYASDNLITVHNLIPYSSSFVIEVVKE